MGEMMKKNTAQKARPKRFRDAPARLSACLVVVLNVSQGFARATKRLAVLLMGRMGGGKGGGEFHSLDIMLQNGRNGAKNTAGKVEVKRFREAPARLTAGLVVLLNDSQGSAPAAKRLAVLLLGGREGGGGVPFP